MNPFSRSAGNGVAWKDQAAYSPNMGTGSSVKGIVAYADSVSQKYCIAGHGTTGLLPLHLLSGQKLDRTRADQPAVSAAPTISSSALSTATCG